MTNTEIAEKYQSMSIELAQIVAKMAEMHRTCQYMTEQTQDAGDPEMDFEDAIRTAGVALAAIVTYAHEYATDFADHEEEDNHEEVDDK